MRMASDPDQVDYGQRLRDRGIELAVWGLGHIGWSTVEAFADQGVRITGYDPDTARITQRMAVLPPSDVRVSADSAAVLGPACLVHMIAVPTEQDGAPFHGALRDVFEKIASVVADGPLRGQRPLVIIESTLTPGDTDNVIVPILRARDLEVGRDLGLAIAPRRDWFLAEGFGLKELDRIYAGYDEFSAQSAESVLRLVNDVLHRAPGHLAGELVKCVENAFRHVDISFANQLTLAFPHVDMVEVLRLAGTKWNVGTYHPSFGTGGYCIPLSSKYLLLGAEQPKELSLLEASVETDARMRRLVAEAASQAGPVLVIGIAYKGGIKVDILSPAHAIVTRLLDAGIETSVWDPMYSPEEIDARLGAPVATRDVTADIARARTILIVSGHQDFVTARFADELNAPRDDELVIIDNYGLLADMRWRDHVRYHRAGDPGWLPADRDGN
jgi:UDP-N-acetyl-D-mannosaminuronic acid dehydrogenase